MNTVAIDIRPRHLAGSAVAKKIRRAELIPANVYGHGLEGNRNVALDPRPLAKALSGPYGRNQLIRFELDGVERIALCKEVAIHPVSHKLQHVDFFCVTPDTPIKVTLPIVLTGRSAGQKAGGRLDVTARFVKVQTTPAKLPSGVELALEPFQNGQLCMVEALPFPDGVTPLYKRNFKVFELIAPKVVKVEAVDPKAAKKKK